MTVRATSLGGPSWVLEVEEPHSSEEKERKGEKGGGSIMTTMDRSEKKSMFDAVVDDWSTLCASLPGTAAGRGTPIRKVADGVTLQVFYHTFLLASWRTLMKQNFTTVRS